MRVPELPQHLYKYQPLTARTLGNLRARTLWFSAPSAFNDPFDCALKIARTILSDAELQRAHQWIATHRDYDPGFDAALVTDGQPNAQFREVFTNIVEQQFETQRLKHFHESGAASFSARFSDPLLWAHYADGHRGMCLEFSTSAEPFSKARPVVYTQDVPQISPVDVLEGKAANLLEAMVRTKSQCWAYEEEWRLLHETASTAYGFDFRLLTGVYLGAAMPPRDRDMVAQLLLGAPTQLYVMAHQPNTFGLAATPVAYTPPSYE